MSTGLCLRRFEIYSCLYRQRFCSRVSSYSRMHEANDARGLIGRNKKKKLMKPVWRRSVNTQTSSIKDDRIKDAAVKSESGSQLQGVQFMIQNDADTMVVADAYSDLADGIVTSRASDEIGENKLVLEESVSAKMHSLSIEVGASVMRFIKGKEGSMHKEIEEEMGVRLVFPSSKKDDSITIEGPSADCVGRASERIQRIIYEVAKTPSLGYSHFISLPLAIHPELVDKLVKFQNSILRNSDFDEDEQTEVAGDSSEDENERTLHESDNVTGECKAASDYERVKVDLTRTPLVSYATKATKSHNFSDLGIEKSIFNKPKTFHFTVLMLKLWNKERVSAAAEVLKKTFSKVMEALGNRPVFVRLKGLDCMRGTLAKAHVIYVPVEEIGNGNRLRNACQVMIDAFVEAGLVMEKDANQKLKLHATVMNTTHRRRKGKTRRKTDSFDARDIFRQFGSEEWGEYLIREAHLSQRFVFDENGYYHRCASIPFPENMLAD